MGEQIEIQAGAATSAGYLAVPAAGAGPGVLVLHAWWGLTPTFTAVCDRLAEAGFVALAPDLHAGQTATTITEAEALLKTQSAGHSAAALGGFDALLAQPGRTGAQVGIVGFSMGAAWALELASARPDQVGAAVLFYGAWEPDFSTSQAAYLGHFAEDDAFDPVEVAYAMEAAIRAAGREITLHVYLGTQHWFFEPDRPEYDPAAAALAWGRTIAFLRERLGAAPPSERTAT